nr:hypothetical protein [Tanacetum cinerariifolium]
MGDEEVAMVDGVFEGAFRALGLEMEALVDAMEELRYVVGDGVLAREATSSSSSSLWSESDILAFDGAVQLNEIRRIKPYGYGISDLLDTSYPTYWVWHIELLRYGVLVSLGTAYWLFGYEELAENVLLMVFDRSIIYGVSVDVDTAYSSKSCNGLEFFKSLDTAYASRMIRRIDVRINDFLKLFVYATKHVLFSVFS